MPELPEVEAFGRWLLPQVRGRSIDTVEVFKPRLVRPVSVPVFIQSVQGSCVQDLRRRGKCLLWDCVRPGGESELLVTHLGMTGSWRILPGHGPLPRHAAVAFGIGEQRVVLEDPRQFGHLRLGNAAVPESSAAAKKPRPGAPNTIPPQWLRTELYFVAVETSEWKAFLAERISPRFPAGFTVFDAYGQWRAPQGNIQRLSTKVVVILHPPTNEAEQAIEAIREKYCAVFNQSSVL